VKCKPDPGDGASAKDHTARGGIHQINILKCTMAWLSPRSLCC